MHHYLQYIAHMENLRNQPAPSLVAWDPAGEIISQAAIDKDKAETIFLFSFIVPTLN